MSTSGSWLAWRDHPQGAGVLLDFDGTLSPIVPHPDDARLIDGASAVLARLAERYGLVAVISGRPAAFLATAIPVPGVQRIGAYGLEQVTADGRVEVDADALAWVPVVGAVVEAANRQAPAGVYVEDKGISVTLHVRNAPTAGAWVRTFAAEQATATGLDVHDAKMSIELRPPLRVDKGTVVRRLVEPLSAACFAGDDVGDLAAFEALATVEVGVRVAVRSGESPPELLEAADVVVDGPHGTLDLLRYLAAPS